MRNMEPDNGLAGSSPTFLATEDLKRVAPVWMNMSIDIFNDAEANKVDSHQ